MEFKAEFMPLRALQRHGACPPRGTETWRMGGSPLPSICIKHPGSITQCWLRPGCEVTACGCMVPGLDDGVLCDRAVCERMLCVCNDVIAWCPSYVALITLHTIVLTSLSGHSCPGSCVFSCILGDPLRARSRGQPLQVCVSPGWGHAQPGLVPLAAGGPACPHPFQGRLQEPSGPPHHEHPGACEVGESPLQPVLGDGAPGSSLGCHRPSSPQAGRVVTAPSSLVPLRSVGWPTWPGSG